MQAVIELLRNEATRGPVLDAVKVLDTQLITFVTLLVKEEARQDEAKRKGEIAITVTDTVCKP